MESEDQTTQGSDHMEDVHPGGVGAADETNDAPAEETPADPGAPTDPGTPAAAAAEPVDEPAPDAPSEAPAPEGGDAGGDAE